MSFRKHGSARALRWEAAGLAWLSGADALPVVDVIELADDHLDLVALTSVPPTSAAARTFGTGLARLHDSGAPAFGAGPPGWDGDGFIGMFPLVNATYPTWGEFYAHARLAPVAQALRAAGDLPSDASKHLEHLSARLCSGELDDDDTPARLHGDLWSGNVMWTPDGATLIDPAAHGGHRECDLAMLALFGAPHLEAIVAGYEQVHPLRPGWRHRTGLHQLFPVAVHAALFGGGYIAQTHALLRESAQSKSR
ncbi:MAG: fructosamine kinase family protein [Micrococcales bacterium]|nr:fructosamine kinase family protein [Micrococcales bacterium]MCL2666265.1 fructosamine kinase family protein [Micrococcales bacterium]